MKIKFSKDLLLACAVLTMTTSGQAATAYLRDTPAPTHFAPGLSRSNVGLINSWNGTAGILDFELSLTSSTNNFFSLLTYCIDPLRALDVGPANGTGGSFNVLSMVDYFTVYTPGVANAATTTNNIQKLWANAFAESKINGTKAAAFQFLLWEYIADSSNFNLTSGIVRITDADVLSQALAWNNSMTRWTSSSNLSVLSGLSNKQSFVLDNGPNTTIPEPTTFVLFSAGLFSLGYFRRK